MSGLFEIIHEDDELLVINKPAGLVCHPTKTDEYSSLIGRVRMHLGKEAHPQLVNRLDRETSGVTLVAKAAEAARELRRLWEERRVEKEYLALVHGHVREESGVVEARLGKDERSRVAIKDCVREDGVAARTRYWVERRFGREGRRENGQWQMENGKGQEPGGQGQMGNGKGQGGDGNFSLLRVRLETGRKHQIRIHLAHLGHPLVGDKLYGGDEDCYLALVENRMTDAHWEQLILPYQALHAVRVRFEWRGKQRVFEAEPEVWFSGFYVMREA